MAAISSTKTGVWSDTTVWSSGALPTSADDVTIGSSHTVTLDITTAVCNTLTVNGGLTASTSASSKVTATGAITFAIGSSYTVALGALPLITHELRHGGLLTFRRSAVACQAYIRKRNTTLTVQATSGAAGSITVADATGWQVGDTIVIANTADLNVAAINEQVVTLTGVTPGSGTTATVTFSGTITATKPAGVPVGNLTSNVMFGPATPLSAGTHMVLYGSATAYTRSFDGVRFDRMGGSSFNARANITTYSEAGEVDAGATTLTRSVFYDGHGVFIGSFEGKVNVNSSDSACWSSSLGSQHALFYASFVNYPFGNTHDDLVIYRKSNSTNYDYDFIDSSRSGPGLTFNRLTICTHHRNSSYIPAQIPFVVNDGKFWGTDTLFYGGNGRKLTFNNLQFGTYGTGATPGWSGIRMQEGTVLEFNSPTFQTGYFNVPYTELEFGGTSDPTKIVIRYMNGVATDSRLYNNAGPVLSDTASRKNSPIDAKLTFASGMKSAQHVDFSILVEPNVTKRLLANITLSSTWGTSPVTVTVYSPAGAVLDSWTSATGTTARQTADLEFSHSEVSSVFCRVEVRGQTSDRTNAYALIDGLPFDPMIPAARWYGFVFNETNPLVSVDPYTTASEATAAAYTGVTINSGTKRVTFGTGTIDSFAKLYDYVQAWGVSAFNGAGYYPMPWTRAGALLALADGWTVVDPAITGMTWGGGTIEYIGAGVKTGSFDSCAFDFTVAGTYTMSDVTFAGQVEFINTSGGAVIVNIPAGVDYVNTGPNITVNEAVVLAAASVTGIEANSRLRVYNETTDTEMANEVVVGTSWSESYEEGTDYTTGDIIRVDVTWCDGATAKLPFRARAVATSSGWSVLVEQEDDDVYNTNAIDGTTVTEFTADFLNVQIDLDDLDGNTTPQRGYAWYVNAVTTENGIRNYFGAMTADDALNYVIENDVVDITLDNVGTNAVSITGAALTRRDGSSPIALTSGSIHLWAGRVYAIETGVSGLTGAEADLLASAANAGNLVITDGAVAANVVAVNDTSVSGSGTAEDPWGP
jgi:hypothetical protein